MIPTGVFCVVLGVMLMLGRFRDPEFSRPQAFAGFLLLLVCGILEAMAGIRGILLLNASLRGRRLRAPEKRVRSLKWMTLFAILFCLVEVVLSCVSGIIFWQLAAMAGAGILFPLIHLLCLRTV